MQEIKIDLVLISDNLCATSSFVKYNRYYKQNLLKNFEKIYLITPQLPDINVWSLGVSEVLLDEDIFGFDIAEEIKSSFENAKVIPRRVGWYAQQLIKLYYSFFTDAEYYMTWDIDTIPLREIPIFNDNLPVINTGRIWRDTYFDIGVKRLFNKKRYSRSTYITEYMIFEASHVRTMLDSFGIKSAACRPSFWEKSMGDFTHDYFSEFEIYGTYLEITGKRIGYSGSKLKSCRNLLNVAPWRSIDRKIELLAKNKYYYSSIESTHISQSCSIKNILKSIYLEFALLFIKVFRINKQMIEQH